MRRLILLILAALPNNALASHSSGTVSASAFNGTGDQETFAFAPSSAITDKPACNTSGRYIIASRPVGTYGAISLLLNLRTPGVWKSPATMQVSGSGACSLANNAEDLTELRVYEGDKLVFSYIRLNKLVVALVLGGQRLVEPDTNHPPPPFIRNLSPARQPHKLEPVITGFKKDVCTLSMMEALDKWGTAATKPGLVDKLVGELGAPFAFGVDLDSILGGVQKVACAAVSSLQKAGIHSWAEFVKGDTATAMWRDDGGSYRGAALFMEDGQWKIDLHNFF
jgi:hypothetical protein